MKIIEGEMPVIDTESPEPPPGDKAILVMNRTHTPSRYEVWEEGKVIANCDSDLPNLQAWIDMVEKAYLGMSEKVLLP